MMDTISRILLPADDAMKSRIILSEGETGGEGGKSALKTLARKNSEESAAILIQSQFRTFQAAKQLEEQKSETIL